MYKVEIKKGGNWFVLELITSTELVMRIANDDEAKTTMFEKIFSFESLDAELKYLFQNIKELYDALGSLINDHNNKGFQLESNGKVHFLLQIKLWEKIIMKRLSFQLLKQLESSQQVHILRANLIVTRIQIAELREGIMKLTEENIQLKAKFNELEKIVLEGINNKDEHYNTSAKYNTNADRFEKKEVESQKNVSSLVQQQQISEQFLKVVPLKIQFDEKCLHLDKFIFTDNKIISQYEDYYQIYNKEPLPKRGIYSFKVKMAGQNHMSIGILGKSALNNQYSFQNNKTVCFYSYFYGNFRGIYFRSKYQPLNWSMEVGQIIHFEIDMNNKVMKIGSKQRKATEMINFKSLSDEEPVYFFIEMYEKDNMIEWVE